MRLACDDLFEAPPASPPNEHAFDLFRIVLQAIPVMSVQE
jgi:hypothetical protein